MVPRAFRRRYGILDHWIGTSPRPHRVELALDLNGDGRFNGDDYAVLDTQIGQGGAALANDPQVYCLQHAAQRGHVGLDLNPLI